MKTKFRRFLALVMALTMLIGCVPDSYAARFDSDTYTIEAVPASVEAAPKANYTHDVIDSSLQIFDDSYKNEAVSVSVVAAGTTGTVKTGEVFPVDVYVSLASVKEYADSTHDDSTYTPLVYSYYENLSIKIQAPEGVVLCDEAGNALPVAEDGSYLVPSISTKVKTYELGEGKNVPAGDRIDGSYKLFAYVDDNGSRTSGSTASFGVKVSADTHVCEPDAWAPACGNELLTEEEKYKTFVPTVVNNTVVNYTAAGDWGIDKAPDGGKTEVQKINDETVTVTYLISVGRENKGFIYEDDKYYNGNEAYGIIDLAADPAGGIVDTIAPVAGLITESGLLPKGVTITRNGVDITANVQLNAADETIRGDIVYQGFTIPQSEYNTLEVPASLHMDRSSVYSFTEFVVTLSYNADEFTYPLFVGEADQTDFAFRNNATLKYTPASEGAQQKTVSDDASAANHFTSDGGNVALNQYLFLDAEATEAESYGTYYSAVFGDITYKLYYKQQLELDADGNPQFGTDGTPVFKASVEKPWSKTLSLSAGSAVTTDNSIPAGEIIIVPMDQAALASGLVKADSNNKTSADGVTVPVYAEVTVHEKQTSPAVNFYLQYVKGGFINITKTYTDINGEAVVAKRAQFEIAEVVKDGDAYTNKVEGYYNNNVWTSAAAGAMEGASGTAVPVDAEGTWFRVKEIATVADGFVTDDNDYYVFIQPGKTETVVVNNYSNDAALELSGFTTDNWNSTAWDTTDGVFAVSGNDYTFEITGSDGSTYTASLMSIAAGKVTLPRYTLDEGGNRVEVITYTVTASASEGTAIYGSIMQPGAVPTGDEKQDGATGVSFTFEDDENLTYAMKWFYESHAVVKITKTVNDSYQSTSAVGWTYTVTAQLNGEDVFTVEGITEEGTDGKGVLSISTYEKDGTLVPLPVADENGNFYTYSIQETNADAGEWNIVYSATAITLSSNLHDAEFEVTNTRKRGKIELTKVDADNTETKLDGAEYLVYVKDASDTTLYLKEVDEGYTFTADEAEATVFTTASGMITLNGVFTGDEDGNAYTYFAQEIKAPVAYICNTDEITLGVVENSGKLEKTLTNVHQPVINVKKSLQDVNGDPVEADDPAHEGTASFDVYYRDAEGNMVKLDVLNAAGESAVVTVAGADVQSADYTLVMTNDITEIYLLETDANGGKWLTPGQQAASSTPVTKVDDIAYFGPYTLSSVQSSSAIRCNAECADVVNTAQLVVTKYDMATGEKVTDMTGAEIVLQAKPADEAAAAFLKSQGFAESTTAEGYLELTPSGEWDAGVFTISVPVMTGSNVVEYRIVELNAPNGYYNELTVTPGATIDDPATIEETELTVDAEEWDWSAPGFVVNLVDAPKATASAQKWSHSVWDYVTGNPKGSEEAVEGITLNIYHINAETGAVDYLVGSAKTDSNGRADFNSLILSGAEEYVIIESDSTDVTGYTYDTRITGSGTSTDSDHSIGDLNPAGMSVAELLTQYGESAVHEIVWSAAGEETSDYVCKDNSAVLTNYVPYIRLQFQKQGYVYRWNSETKEYEKESGPDPLAHCQFKMYSLTVEQYNENKLEDGMVAQSVLQSIGVTDGVTYESDNNGNVVTAPDVYDENKVYFFVETSARINYSNENPVVGPILPEKYSAGRNSVYEYTEKEVANIAKYKGPGNDYFERFMNFEVEKYMDMNADGVLDSGDKPLAGVTFHLSLATKANEVVKKNGKDVLTASFVTGITDGRDAGYGVSASLDIGSAVRGSALTDAEKDAIFTFYYNGSEIKEDGTPYTYQDYKNAHADGLLLAKFDVACNFILCEDKYPGNVTPYETERCFTVKTNGSIYSTNTYWTGDNTIMNLYGTYVLVTIGKLVGNGTAWTTALEDDYVEFTFVANTSSTLDDFIKETSVQIYKDKAILITTTNKGTTAAVVDGNAQNLPLVHLTADTAYTVSETHVPVGYDKPVTNSKAIDPIDISTRWTGEIKSFTMTDAEYVPITVTKLDEDGNGVGNVYLEIYYASDTAADGAILDANHEGLPMGECGNLYRTAGTTNEDGSVTFIVPRYDYSADEVNTAAEYRVVEKNSGGVDSGFSVMNEKVIGNISTASIDASGKHITVTNPAAGNITLTKYSTEATNTPLEGVSFKLYWIPFTNVGTQVLQTAVTKPSTTNWELVAEEGTGADGSITFKNLYSGYYRLVEDIPAGYMNDAGEGKDEYTVEFTYVTPKDVARLQQVYTGDYFWKTASVTITSGAQYKTYNTAWVEEASGVLCVSNTPKGNLEINKTFEANEVEVSAPGKVKYTVKDSAGKTVWEKEIIITDGKGTSTTETDGVKQFIQLAPGKYTVIEEYTANTDGWFATYTTQNLYNAESGFSPVSDEEVLKPVVGNGKVTNTVTVTVEAANTKARQASDGTVVATDKPVVVTMYNRTAKMEWLLKKVDDSNDDPTLSNPVENAEFVAYYEDGDKVYYYAGQDTANSGTGLGKWVTGLNGAKVFSTDEDGILDVVVYGDYTFMKNGEPFEQKVTLREIRADEQYRTLTDTVTTTLTAGTVVDWTAEEYAANINMNKLGDHETAQWLEDGSGLYLTVNLVGHTYGNRDSEKQTPSVEGAQFSLYRVKYNKGTKTQVDAVLVPVTDSDGVEKTTLTLIADPADPDSGSVNFNYLYPLDEQHFPDIDQYDYAYVIVEMRPAEEYFGPETEATKGVWNDEKYHYIVNGSNNAPDTTIFGSAMNGYEVAWPDGQKNTSITLYNMPKSSLVVLKYNIDYPTEADKIPDGAMFSATLKEGTSEYWDEFSTTAISAKKNNTKVEGLETLTLGDKEFTLTSGGYYCDADGVVYSYDVKTLNNSVVKGTYTVKETNNAEGFFMFDGMVIDDPTVPWCNQKEVDVDDDGGVAVVVFGNLPNPKDMGVSLDKTVTRINDGDEMLDNLQDNEKADSWQTVTYTIDHFAPGKQQDSEEAPESIKYPLDTLSLTDTGITFKDSENQTVTNGEDWVVSIAVGSFGYRKDGVVTTSDNLCVEVYGLTDAAASTDIDTATLLVTFTSEGGTYTFADETYDGFVLSYKDGEGLRQNFFATAVSVVYKVRQTSDADQDLAAKVINSAGVKMVYDLGVTSDEVHITAECQMDTTSTAVADPELKLPLAEITKVMYVIDTENYSPDANGHYPAAAKTKANKVSPGDLVEYVVTMTNLDAVDGGKFIPTPFIADVMPAGVVLAEDADYEIAWVEIAPAGVTFQDVVELGEERMVYVTSTADSKLAPQDSIVLHIVGTIDSAAAAESGATNPKNTAYAGSETTIGKNLQNVYGTSFRTSENKAPSERVIGADGTNENKFKDLRTIKATHTAELVWNGEVSLMKTVAANVTDNADGSHNWKSGSTLAITEPSDMDAETPVENIIYYHVVAYNTAEINSTADKPTLRIADKLPKVGDTWTISSGRRNSANGSFGVAAFSDGTTVHNFTVTVYNEKTKQSQTLTSSDYQVYYLASGNVGSTNFTTALKNGVKGNANWTSSAADAGAFLVEFTCKLEANSRITIAYECKAPEGASGTSVNYNKICANDAAFWYKAPNNLETVDSSNVAKVTMLPPYYASIGTRVWLDLNANGIQDKGEPDFTNVAALRLKTWRSPKNATTSANYSLSSAHLTLGNLRTGVTTYDKSMVYDANGNTVFANLNGSNRYVYELVIDAKDIPAGYYVTGAYQGNGGTPTVLDATVPEGATDNLRYYNNNTSDGHAVDSDFRLNKSDNQYKTTQFYLPMVAGQDEASYPFYDLGLVRVRDLKIVKKGDNKQLEANAEFAVYGPFESVDGLNLDADDIPAPIIAKTDDQGVLEIHSTQDLYLNYYGYYVIVETESGEDYLTTKILKINNADWNETATISGSMLKDQNWFVLAPHAEDEAVQPVESIELADQYIANGNLTIDLTKALSDVRNEANENMSEDGPFNQEQFVFVLASDQDAANLPDGKMELSLKGNKTSAELAYSIDRYLDDESWTIDYKLTEKDPGLKGVGYDPAEYIIHVVISDADGIGELTVETSITRKTTEEESTVESIDFTNPLYHGEVSISKTVEGSQIEETGDSFTFEIVLEPETNSMKKAVFDRTYPVSGLADVDSVYVDEDGKAQITLKDNETAVIKDIPAGTKVTVTEQMDDDDLYVNGKPEQTGIIEKDNSLPLEFTNTRYVGDFKLTKTVFGGDPDQEFTFQLKLDIDTSALGTAEKAYYDLLTSEGLSAYYGREFIVEGNDAVTSIQFTKGTATEVTLKHGESILIKELPVGAKIIVAEQNIDELRAEGYYIYTDNNETPAAVKPTGAESTATSGVIKVNGDVKYANFYNTNAAGTMTITKQLDSAAVLADENDMFEYTITFVSPDAEHTSSVYRAYNVKVTNPEREERSVTLTVAPNAGLTAGVGKLYLYAGDTAAINGILAETSYTVEETGVVPGNADAYGTGTFALKALGYSVKTSAYLTGIIGETVSTPSVTNTRTANTLTVKKTVTGNAGETDREFTMTVKVTYPVGVTVPKEFSMLKNGTAFADYSLTISNQSAVITFTLKDQDSMAIENLLSDATVNVFEGNAIDEYRVYDYNTSYQLDGKSVNGYEVAGLSMAGKDHTVTVINNREVGEIDLTKVVTGTDTVGDYQFTLKLTYESDIDLTAEVNLPEVKAGDVVVAPSVSGNTLTYTATIKNNEHLTLQKVLVGTDYTVYEEDYRQDGYLKTTIKGPDGTVEKTYDTTVDVTGAITAEKQKDVWTYTNIRKAGSLNITKTLSGNGKLVEVTDTNPDGKDFTINITLKREDGNHIFGGYPGNAKAGAKVTASGIEWTIQNDMSLKGTVVLKGQNSNTKLIEDILAGTAYTITEDSERAYDYTVMYDGKAANDACTGEIKQDQTAAAAINNDRTYGSIEVTKMTDTGTTGTDTVTDFEFTLVLTYENDIDLNLVDNQSVATIGTTKVAPAVGKHTITYNVILQKDQTLVLDNVLVGTDYTVYEEDYRQDGYLKTTIKGPDGTVEKTYDTTVDVTGAITAEEQKDVWTYTNIREAGSLNITKTLSGSASVLDEQKFEFTVTLEREDGFDIFDNYPENAKAGDIVEASGIEWTIQADHSLVGIIYLTGMDEGKTWMIEDILAGTDYTVEEKSYAYLDYTTTTNGECGIIEKDTTAKNTWNNDRTTGSLSLTKKVDGASTLVSEFAFEITLTYEDHVMLKDAEGNPVADNMPVISDDTAQMKIKGQQIIVSCTLEDGEKITLDNLLVGTKYVISEADEYRQYGYVECWITDPDKVKTSGMVTEESEIAKDGKLYSWSFRNVRKASTLTVTKTLDGNATDSEKEFEFTVTLYDTDGMKPQLSYPTVKNYTEEGTIVFTRNNAKKCATATFTLKGGESLVINDVNIGTDYLVEEADYQADGYLTTSKDASGAVLAKGSVAAYTNTRNIDSLTIQKKLAGNAPEVGMRFKMTVTLSREDNIPVAGTYTTVAGDMVEFVANGTRSATAVIMVRGGGSVEIQGIPRDTYYTVTEADYTADDYTTEYVRAKGFVEEDGMTAIVTNTRNTGELTITKTVNTNGLELSEVNREFEFTVTITKADGTALTRAMTAVDQDGAVRTVTFVNGKAQIRLGHGDELTIQDIPEGAVYTVAEKEYVGIASVVSNASGTMTIDGAVVNAVNTITQAYMDLTVRKAWDDHNNPKRPDHIIVIVRDGVNADVEIELSDENNWTYTLESLPRFTEDGTLLVYTVIEKEVPDGYKVKYTLSGTLVTVTNHKDPFETIQEYDIPLGVGVNMNEGYCFD